jgi:hypothetical protein
MSSGAGKRNRVNGTPKPSKGKIVQDLENRVQNLEMGLRVSQMLVRQLMENMQPMKNDLGELAIRQKELQYRALAFQELTSLDSDKIQDLSLQLQIKDFEESSDKEDKELEYTVADVVAEDSAVILTSSAPSDDGDKGILRSKLLISEIQFPDLREALIGKKTGDKLDHNINGIDHNIEILGIRTVPPVKEETVEAVNTEVASENAEA